MSEDKLNLEKGLSFVSKAHTSIPMNHPIMFTKEGIWSFVNSFLFVPVKVCSGKHILEYKSLQSVVTETTEPSFENKKLKLKKGKLSIKLNYLSDIFEFGKLIKKFKKNIKKAEWKDVPDDFLKGMRVSLNTISEDPINGTLTCLNIDKDKLVSSNNVSVMVYTLKEKFDKAFLLEKSVVQAILNLSPVKMAFIKKALLVKTEAGIVAQFPIVQGSFPDFMSVIEIDPQYGIKLKKDVLKELVQASETLFEGTDYLNNTLQFTVKDQHLTVKNKFGKGKVSAKYNLKTPTKEATFSLDSKTLENMLQFETTVGIRNDKAVIQTDNIRFVCALRIKY